MKSRWREFYPDGWKNRVQDGKPLEQHSWEVRRAFQRCFEENGMIEQAAFDAAVIDEIRAGLHYTVDDFDSKTSGEIAKWASWTG